jgi:uncharacterized membrane protein YraQ (UPF0718 family)
LRVCNQRYAPAEGFAKLFGKKMALGLLMAATIGVSLYACGDGITLLYGWLRVGMSTGSASAFMITGLATKITNLRAVKIVLGMKNFIPYLLYTPLFTFLCGLFIDYALNITV